jgi:hypothetical protein
MEEDKKAAHEEEKVPP